MKILFSADWHIKLGQKNVPVSWAINRYNTFFALISQLESQCDLHIIGGDLFDRLPTMEELGLYFSFVAKVTIPTIIYDGNHEATKKGQTFLSHLKEVTNRINPLVEIVTETKEYDEFTILPYTDLHKKGSIEALNQNKVVFTHVRGEIPPHVKPEVDLDRFSNFPLVFAGDLHSHSNCQRNIHYPGSPMTTSFHRSEVETGVIIIDSSLWEYEWVRLDLPQLIRKTVTSEAEMLQTDFHHTIYELEGDLEDLAKIENSELLDKKVVKRSSEATLVITKEMTIEDELIEYLSYILELPEEKIAPIIGTFNDYAKNTRVG